MFLSFPIADYQTPNSFAETANFIGLLEKSVKDRKKILIHCRQGIGRASLIVACLLVKQGYSSNTVFDLISEKRKKKVPDTKKQIDWLKEFAERYL